MRFRTFLFLSLSLAASSLSAQQWHVFDRGAAFATLVTQTGPQNPQNRFFSTNWLSGGAERNYGDVSVMVRGRVSLEPLTVPAEGSPQLLQYISPPSGGPLLDHMRAHDLIEEAAVQVGWKALRLYVAPIGEPPLGATPYAQRESALDFAEAPFSYDVAESFHVGTRVVVAGITTAPFDVEAGVFHNSVSTGRHATIKDGPIDSWSARVTFRPAPHWSVDASHGSLGDAKQKVTSGSLSYESPHVVTSAIFTRREPLNAYGLEVVLRGGRNAFMVRAESTDRPAGSVYVQARRATNLTLGDVVDVYRRGRLRTGLGVNIDYQTSTGELKERYGHKPQSVYTFVRVRCD